VAEINVTNPTEEIRFVAKDDPSTLRAMIDYVLPDDMNRIVNAIGQDRGVTLGEFATLLFNAGVRKSSHFAATHVVSLPCNIAPECNDFLGHLGECDTEVPF